MKEIGVGFDNLKQLIFGTNIKPDLSQATLFKVLFWPDAFLFLSVLLSILLVVVVCLFFRKNIVLKIKANIASVSAVLFFRFVCFLALVGSVSATSRMFVFIFGGSAEGYGNQAAFTIFSMIFSIPAFFSLSLVAVCGTAMYFLFGLKLQQ